MGSIVGTFTEDGQEYYYVNSEHGDVRRYPAEELREHRADLVAEFDRKRANGEIGDFDPSSTIVHSDSRVRLKIRLGKNQRAVSSDYNKTPASDSDSGTSDEDEDEDMLQDKDEEMETPEGSEDSEGESSTAPARASGRLAVKSTTELPFSPRKTRAKKKFFTHDDDGSAHSMDEQPRRSSRARKSTRRDDDDDVAFIDDDDGNDSQDSDIVEVRRPKKPKRVSTLPLPVVGEVHSVDERVDDPNPSTAACRNHREACEKCGLGPSHTMKKKARRRKLDEFEEDNDSLGGWLRCTRCPVANHWGCISGTKQSELIRTIHQAETATWRSRHGEEASSRRSPAPSKREDLEDRETTGFLCAWCSKAAPESCFSCHETVPSPLPVTEDPVEPLFRCNICTRASHYAHLHQPPGEEDPKDAGELATYYQSMLRWKCWDCASFNYPLDKIIAWRPFPANAKETGSGPLHIPDYSASLPREYLVKWQDKSYRRVGWVPHMWLFATNRQKLRKFVQEGRTLKLLDQATQEAEAKEAEEHGMMMDVDDEEMLIEDGMPSLTKQAALLAPLVDAEQRIPPAWRTVDRVLDVMIWHPPTPKSAKKSKGGKKSKRVDSDEELTPEAQAQLDDAINYGDQPEMSFMETIEDYEKRTKRNISVNEAGDVIWALFKWGDLGYDEATWDSPPQEGDPGYEAYERAYGRFIKARSIPKATGPSGLAKGKRPRSHWMRNPLKNNDILDLGQDPKYKLMDFQVDGFNWLVNNWWNTQHCILADEMGLGKTVQIATFLGKIIKDFNAYPALVVVPNSTITNWVREIERWAPELHVVPFFGDARARSTIITYELQKFHVIVASYEAFSVGPDFNRVFKKQPRWEVLVVDEGQRLKNNESITFKKLNELNSLHRIIMTGTPLNNNIRELFNLMNFLDPDKWWDLESLEKEHEILTEELVKDLHERLRPYFLRRTKKEVLKLPPKNEVIVPISMAPLQRDVYKSILSGNYDILQRLSKDTRVSTSLASLKNMLMQLRKCLQHPYLVSSEIEATGLSDKETHEKFVEASTKLAFLRQLLPQLKARGHRVLLFSQFSMALDILEDFCRGEKFKYLRLDGSMSQRTRQEGIDEFNREGSDVFLYMLTTRAGGAGINLWTADTVIIFDPDFNPHQDLQAIARAHRFGQTKTVLVFKFMIKNSAEERIVQTGKKKLVLDHLIVQKMDDDEPGGNDVKSILMYGAQALFAEDGQSNRDITYTEADITHLIEKTEQANDEEVDEEGGGFSFSFAKVWAAEKAALDELPEPAAETEDWAATLAKMGEERAKAAAAEIQGRGARRKATQAVQYGAGVDDVVDKDKDKKKVNKGKRKAEDSDFSASDDDSISGSSSAGEREEDPAFQPPTGADLIQCGLCAGRHRPGEVCSMTENSDFLAEYRMILLTQSSHEPWQKRISAIQSIEETLYRRGDLAKIQGQPLHLVQGPDPVPAQSSKAQPKRPKQPKALTAGSSRSKGADAAAASGSGSRSGAAHAHASASASAGPSASTSAVQINHGAEVAARPADKCPICAQRPYHTIVECPLIQSGGTDSITKAIIKLNEKPVTDLIGSTLQDLRKLLRRMKKQETQRAAAVAAPSVMQNQPITAGPGVTQGISQAAKAKQAHPPAPPAAAVARTTVPQNGSAMQIG